MGFERSWRTVGEGLEELGLFYSKTPADKNDNLMYIGSPILGFAVANGARKLNDRNVCSCSDAEALCIRKQTKRQIQVTSGNPVGSSPT